MELCHSLRKLFRPSILRCITVAAVRHYVNAALERNFTEEQVMIGMDYAGFERGDGGYRVEQREAENQLKPDALTEAPVRPETS